MSDRMPGSSSSGAEAFINLYDAQVYYGELIPLSEWFQPEDGGFGWVQGGEFWIGGINPHGIEDEQDIAPIWLKTEFTYSFGLFGEYDNVDEGLTLEIIDDYGYPLLSNHSDDNPDDKGLLETWRIASVEDGIYDFRPSYTGWHNIWIHTDSPKIINATIMIGANIADAIVLPHIMNRDDSNWDNDINTGRDTYIAAEDAQLYRAYMGAMGRLPDWGGFNWWAYEIKQGENDLFTMADGFIRSSEFKELADSNYDNYISNHEFISHMYEGVFGRAPDQGGYEYWMDELNSGESDQAEVLIYMTQSNEYIDQTLEVVADYLFL